VDLEEEYNMFVTEDKNIQNILSASINADFKETISIRKDILMRKQIVPIIKEYLEDPVKETIKAYDGYSEHYQNLYPKVDMIQEQMEKFVELLGDREGAKVLDIGCGHGRDAKHLSEIGYEVTGIDLSEGLLKIAKENSPGCNFQKMDMRNLDFPDDNFDGIWACASFLHIPWREAKDTLKGFVHVLKPKGVICISVKEGKEEEFVKKDHYKGGVKFFANYTKDDIKRLFEEEGLEVIDLIIDNKKDKWINVFGRKSA
jgi:ubiquinone/menaquinone biosynthesis C-methylase UbiE